MKKWVKATLVVTPLVLGTSVYAFANERSTSQATIQIQEVQPAQTVTADAQTSSILSEIPNPFVMQQNQTSAVSSQAAATTQTDATATATAADLNIDQIAKLHIQAKTDRGTLQLEYHLEGNGTPRLNGKIGDMQVHLSGDKAKELMNLLLTRWNLLATLQQAANNPSLNVNGKLVSALDEFEVTTKAGKTLETKVDGEMKAEVEQTKSDPRPAFVQEKHAAKGQATLQLKLEKKDKEHDEYATEKGERDDD